MKALQLPHDVPVNGVCDEIEHVVARREQIGDMCVRIEEAASPRDHALIDQPIVARVDGDNIPGPVP